MRDRSIFNLNNSFMGLNLQGTNNNIHSGFSVLKVSKMWADIGLLERCRGNRRRIQFRDISTRCDTMIVLFVRNKIYYYY